MIGSAAYTEISTRHSTEDHPLEKNGQLFLVVSNVKKVGTSLRFMI